MKSKLKITEVVIPMPGKPDGIYMLQRQYVEGGPVHTDDNAGQGYTLEAAQARKLPVVSEVRS